MYRKQHDTIDLHCDSCMFIRYLDFSFLCTFVLRNEKSTERTFAPVEVSFPGTFAPEERKVQELSLLGTFAPQEQMFQELSQCSRARSHTLTLFRLDALVH